MIKVKRVYEPSDENDGIRFLVERLWPRGIKKENLHIDSWLKNVAPSSELRKWFNHDPHKWIEFKQRYWAELSKNRGSLEPIYSNKNNSTITLLFSARDLEHNNAIVLKEYLDTHDA